MLMVGEGGGDRCLMSAIGWFAEYSAVGSG